LSKFSAAAYRAAAPTCRTFMEGFRTTALHAAGAALFVSQVLAAAAAAETQAWPTRPIRLIAPFSAGAGADVAARLLAKSLTDTLQQQVIIDNRPGGGSVPATAVAANATADGYTILWVSGAHAINAAFRTGLPYDPIRSFEPVALFARMPFVLVIHPTLAAKSVPELLALVRANPGKLNYASSGTGSASHLGLEMLKLYAKLDMVNVSYKGAAPSIAALLGGEVQMALLGPLSVKPHVTAGKLRPLAVTTAARSAAFPNLPTLAESGVAKYEMTSWYGILAPRGVPSATIARLNEAVAAAQTSRSVSDVLASEGAELPRLTPRQFEDFLRAETARYAELSRRLNLRLD
jgi:tripartite-type tricarboxylate transporter receptor subunit TctC